MKSQVRAIIGLLLFFSSLSFAAETSPNSQKKYLDQFIRKTTQAPISKDTLNELWEELIQDSKIRTPCPNNPNGGGMCWERANYLDTWLKERNIDGGTILMGCPGDDIQGTDQVTQVKYRYANYHIANTALVRSETGVDLYILDPQFMATPVLLFDYLSSVIPEHAYLPLSRNLDLEMPDGSDLSVPCRWFLGEITR